MIFQYNISCFIINKNWNIQIIANDFNGVDNLFFRKLFVLFEFL